MSIPPEFFEIVSKCELSVKRAMLEALIKDIQVVYKTRRHHLRQNRL